MTGAYVLLVPGYAGPFADHRSGGVVRQRGGAQYLGRGGGDLPHQGVSGALVPVPERADEHDPQPPQPFGEVGEPAQGGDVHPLEVVDEDEQPGVFADVGEERARTVQGRLGRGAGRAPDARAVGRLPHRHVLGERPAGRSVVGAEHQAGGPAGFARPALAVRLRGAGEQTVEQLPDHTEREVPLHRGGVRPQDSYVRTGDDTGQSAQQGGSSDAEWSAQQDHR